MTLVEFFCVYGKASGISYEVPTLRSKC